MKDYPYITKGEEIYRSSAVPTPKKKLIFYVDKECSFSTEHGCSYYSSRQVQERARQSSKNEWGECCPIVYVKSGARKYSAFCPTKGGAWGEQLPVTVERPGPDALRVEVKPHANETWAEILERAAKIACETRCE